MNSLKIFTKMIANQPFSGFDRQIYLQKVIIFVCTVVTADVNLSFCFGLKISRFYEITYCLALHQYINICKRLQFTMIRMRAVTQIYRPYHNNLLLSLNFPM